MSEDDSFSDELAQAAFEKAEISQQNQRIPMSMYKCDGCHELTNNLNHWRYYNFNFLKAVKICPACIPRWHKHFEILQKAGL